MNKIFTDPLTVFVVLFTIDLFVPRQVFVHCDGLDGRAHLRHAKGAATGH
jgi:hypothetical protein